MSRGKKKLGYKAFNKDLTCRDFQYEVGKEYVIKGELKACSNGFHACEMPLSVLQFYPITTSVFGTVEQYGEVSSDDTKTVSSKIKVTEIITLSELIKKQIKFVLSSASSDQLVATNTDSRSVATNTGYSSVVTNTGDYSVATNTGNRSVATNTGDRSVATNTGNWSAATNTGDWSVATNTGNWSAATNTGDWSVSTNTGYSSVVTNTGDYSVANNTGNRSVATNTGDRSVATNTGNWSVATNTGKDSIALAAGYKSKASGTIGAWLFIVERDEDYHIINAKTGLVGRDLKEDTFYAVINNEFVEVGEDYEW